MLTIKHTTDYEQGKKCSFCDGKCFCLGTYELKNGTTNEIVARCCTHCIDEIIRGVPERAKKIVTPRPRYMENGNEERMKEWRVKCT